MPDRAIAREMERAMEAARAGNYPHARELAVAVLDLAPPDSLLAAQAGNLLGGIAFEQGNLHEAERRFEEVLSRGRQRRESPLLARAANNLASIAHLRGKPTLAITLYRSALCLWEDLGDPAGEAQTCHNLSLIMREQGLLDEAWHLSERAVDAARRSCDDALLGLAYLGRAETALALGDMVAAHSNVQLGCRAARSASDWLGLADARRVEAHVAIAEGRARAALRAALTGQRQAARLGGRQLAAECAEIAGRASLLLGHLAEAQKYYRLAAHGFRTIGAEPSARRAREEAFA